jgi:hypothetical protein
MIYAADAASTKMEKANNYNSKFIPCGSVHPHSTWLWEAADSMPGAVGPTVQQPHQVYGINIHPVHSCAAIFSATRLFACTSGLAIQG